MVTEGAPERAGHLTGLESLDGLVDLRHELALGDQAEVAAAARGRRVLRHLPRDQSEIGAAPDARHRALGPGLGLILGGAAPDRGHLDEDVGDPRPRGLLELAPPRLEGGLHVGVGDGRRRHARRGEQRRDHLAALGLGELRRMRLVVGLELGVGRRERVARACRDQEVARSDLAPIRFPRLASLGLGDLRALHDQRLQALPHQLGPELALEVAGRHRGLGHGEEPHVAVAREAAALLEGADAHDLLGELAVGDVDALAGRALRDEPLVDEPLGHLLAEPQHLRQLLRPAVAGHLTGLLDGRPVGAVEGHGRHGVAVDRHNGGPTPAPAVRAPLGPEVGEAHDEGNQHGGE